MSRLIHGVLAVGTVVALTAYLGRLYGPLTQLSNLNIDYMSAMVSFERLFEVLDLEPMIKESPNARPIPTGPAELRFNHVDFSYPGAEDVSLASLEAVARLDDTPRTAVLHDVNFRRRAGHHDGARWAERRGQDDDLDVGVAALRRRRRLRVRSMAWTFVRRRPRR